MGVERGNIQGNEVDPMKSYTTLNVLPDDVRYLPMQLAGAEPGELADLLQGRPLLGYSIPAAQEAAVAWQVILKFSSDVSIEITCSNTVVERWEAFGSVNVEVLACATADLACASAIHELPKGLCVARTEIVRWKSAGLIVDAGIRLQLSDGRTLTAVALDAPGAVCLTLPGDTDPQSWQFPAHEYVYVAMYEAG